jgi:glycosyltransferase involved in cell wall biosynthesis
LREAIESALAQTYPPLEVIVVDDGSTDDTRAVCEAFGRSIQYIYRENDRTFGIGARARAMREAKGEWIALLDHDDRWRPEKIEKQVKAIGQFPDVMAAFTRFDVIDENSRPAPETRQTSGETQYMPARDAFHYLLTENPFAPSTAMVRRSFIELHGITEPTESGCADWDLWLSIARHYPVALVDELLTEYRILSGQFCSDKQRLADALERSHRAQLGRLHENCAGCRDAYRQGQTHIAGVYSVAARTLLDQYHAAVRAGNVSQALPFLTNAVRISPGEVLTPRRMLAISKNGARGVLKGLRRAGKT